MSKSEIFTNAWALAKRGAVKFGGSSKDFFAEALKIVYAQSHVCKFRADTSHGKPAWMAKVEGLDARYGFQRTWVYGREFKDGYLVAEFELTDGVYNYGRRNKRGNEFIIVRNGEATEISHDEAEAMFA